jgi:hydrogenase-4 component E
MSDPNLWVDSAAVLLVLTGLGLLGTSHIGSGIRLIALQGALLASIALLGEGDAVTARSIGLATATLVLKGGLFPWLLVRAQREARVQAELEPFVGYQFSLASGVVLLGVAVWLSHRLAVVPPVESLNLAVGLFLIFAGLFILVSRRIAVGQVFGYIVLENGIALFGLTVAGDEPLLIELGILLDVFVAVFVMGIAIVHINREFDHIEVDRLTALRD